MMKKDNNFIPPEQPDDPDWDDDEIRLPLDCPNCGTEYDEIDYEYQICHYCGYNNNPKK